MKSPLPKPKKKPLGDRIKLQKRKTWQAISRYVRARDRRCVTCEEGVAENAGHYQHNGDKENKNLGGNMLWYDIRNLNGQCVSCNKYRNGNPRPYALYLRQTYGPDILEELNALYRTEKKWTLDELVAIEAKYDALAPTIHY